MTHNLTLLPQVDLIVVMENGQIAQVGTYQDLLSKNTINLLHVYSEESGKDMMINKPGAQFVYSL